MSAEMFSGDISDFEAAAQRCPFLSSLGEAALAEIRRELAATLVEEPIAALATEQPKPEPAVASHAAPERTTTKMLPERTFAATVESSVVVKTPAVDEQPQRWQHETSLRAEQTWQETLQLQTERLEALRAQETPPSAVESLPVASVTPRLEIDSHHTAPEIAAVEQVALAPVVVVANEVAPTVQPVEIAEMPPVTVLATADSAVEYPILPVASVPVEIAGREESSSVAVERAEVTLPEVLAAEIPAALRELLAPALLVGEQAEQVDSSAPLEQDAATELHLSLQLQAYIDLEVAPENQEAATNLLEQTYQLAAELAAELPDGGREQSTALQEELETLVAELLQTLGVETPSPELVSWFTMRLQSEVAEASDSTPLDWFEDVLRERLGTIVATPADSGLSVSGRVHTWLGQLAVSFHALGPRAVVQPARISG